MRNRATDRKAFTLAELLVVIGIMLVLASLTYILFRTGSGSEKMRSAARVAQSAFMGAKDRALHSGGSRGIRLMRDTLNSNFVTSFAYVQPLPLQTSSGITVDRPTPNSPDAIDLLIPAPTGSAWFSQDQQGFWQTGVMFDVRVRIPAGTGISYAIVRQSNSAPFWGTLDKNGTLHLTLTSSYQGGNSPPGPAVTPLGTPALASCDLLLGNELMPFHQSISLPAGTVIDLANSSQNVKQIASGVATNLDIMFSPRGSISGPLSAQGPLHFLVRDLQDATAGCNPFAVGNAQSANPDLSRGDRLIVTLFPQTGLVQTFDIDPTDGNGDGIADNPFNFAQQGKSAGR